MKNHAKDLLILLMIVIFKKFKTKIGNTNFLDNKFKEKKINLIKEIKTTLFKKGFNVESNNKNISVGITNLEFHNLFSIYHAVKSLGYKVKIYSLEQSKYNCDILIFPGIGSFNSAMKGNKKK